MRNNLWPVNQSSDELNTGKSPISVVNKGLFLQGKEKAAPKGGHLKSLKDVKDLRVHCSRRSTC